MKRMLAWLLVFVMAVGMIGCANGSSGEETKQTQTTEESKLKLKDGVYVETVYGNNFTMPFEVTVTISDNKVTAIEITDRGGEYSEYDYSILETAINNLIPRIIETQSLSVDFITGATLSSAGIKQAVYQAVEKAGGNGIDWYRDIEKSTETIVVKDYDVIVVGLGASGVAAYMSAAESGASVFGVEAAGRVGGTSSLTSGPMAVNPSSAMVQPEPNDMYPTDEDAFIAQWIADTKGEAKNDCIELIVRQSGDVLDWTIETLGYRYFPVTSFLYPDLQIWANYDYTEMSSQQMFVNALEKANGLNDENQYVLELKATDILVNDNGQVAGVKATYYDGTIYEIYAPAVILCTGGFGGNAEMTKEAFGYPIKLHGMYQNDGTMIQAAIENLGAGTFSMSSAGMCHSGRVPNVMHLEGVVPSHNKVLNAIVNNANVLAVNANGERFTNEGMGMTLAEYYWKAGTENYYVIVDQEYMDNIKANGLESVYMMVNSQDFTNPAWYPFSDPALYYLEAGVPIEDMDLVIEGAIAAGNLYRGSSIEDLAKQLNMYALVDTFTAYNQACIEGVDKEFGKDASLLVGINEESERLYAIKASAYCYSTNGALDVNSNIEVLDTEGNVIPGLYACGTDSMGVLFTEETGYIDYGGVAHSWCSVSGKIAGKNAATYAQGK